jgi:hypothetical protein
MMGGRTPSNKRFKAARLATLLPLFVLLSMGADNCKHPGDPINLCERMARLQCKFLYQCCNAHERSSSSDGSLPHSTEAECVEVALKEVCPGYQVLQESIDAERMEWDSEKADACIKAQEEATNQCDIQSYYDQFSDDECAMSNWPKGKVKNGDTCYNDAECEGDGAQCEPEEPDAEDDTVTLTAKGKCKDRGGDGDPCDYPEDCREGFFCDYNDGDVCRAKLGNGESCNYNNQACQSGHCNEMDLTCAPKLADGEGCYENSMCESDFCNYNTGLCSDPVEGEGEIIWDYCDGQD